MQSARRSEPAASQGSAHGRVAGKLLLVAVAIGCAGAVAFGLIRGAQWGSAVAGFDKVEEEPLVPELANGTGNADRVTISTQEGTLELVRADGSWLLASHARYPARSDLVESLLRQLSDLSVSYRGEPDNRDYAAYGLHPPGEPAPDVPKIEVADADGNILVALAVGDSVSVPGGSQLETIAVRREDSSRMLLVTGRLQAPSDWRSWVDREIAKIPRAEVESLTLLSPAGRTLTVSRAEDGSLRLSGAAEERAQEIGETVLDESAALLELLIFEDVRPLARGAGAAGTGGWEAEILTADNVRYRMVARLEEGQGMWLTLSARGTDAESGRDALHFNSRVMGWEFGVGPLGAERLTPLAAALGDER